MMPDAAYAVLICSAVLPPVASSPQFAVNGTNKEKFEKAAASYL